MWLGRPPGFRYTIEEHAQVVGELVDHVGLDGYLTMGQDWGGPISMAVDTARTDRVRGVSCPMLAISSRKMPGCYRRSERFR